MTSIDDINQDGREVVRELVAIVETDALEAEVLVRPSVTHAR